MAGQLHGKKIMEMEEAINFRLKQKTDRKNKKHIFMVVCSVNDEHLVGDKKLAGAS